MMWPHEEDINSDDICFCVWDKRRWLINVRRDTFNFYGTVWVVLDSGHVPIIGEAKSASYERVIESLEQTIKSPWRTIIWVWQTEYLLQKLAEWNLSESEAYEFLQHVHELYKKDVYEAFEEAMSEIHPRLIENVRVARSLE